MWIGCVALLASCSDAAAPSDDDGGVEIDDLPVVCTGGTAFSPGTSYFTEVTGAAGLTGIGGQRMNIVDFDSDGFVS